ncbi:unnamed protein product [Cuscuta campestris]|uniref:Uncharacterized protein n=1 Tax=Cuscuta campestris TaxID=132261 RepID=A0A484KEM3_9ASTE|nr:unnamed protein product [Cuscuta campestris]
MAICLFRTFLCYVLFRRSLCTSSVLLCLFLSLLGAAAVLPTRDVVAGDPAAGQNVRRWLELGSRYSLDNRIGDLSF